MHRVIHHQHSLILLDVIALSINREGQCLVIAELSV